MKVTDKLAAIDARVLYALSKYDIDQIYSGRPGCACGCRGSYTEGAKGVRKLCNMVRFAEETGAPVQIMESRMNPGFIITCEDGDKIYSVYLTAEATARLHPMIAAETFPAKELRATPKPRAAKPSAPKAAPIQTGKPKVKLVGEDGNAFSIIGRVSRALKPFGKDAEFRQKAFAAQSYDALLRLAMEYADVC